MRTDARERMAIRFRAGKLRDLQPADVVEVVVDYLAWRHARVGTERKGRRLHLLCERIRRLSALVNPKPPVHTKK